MKIYYIVSVPKETIHSAALNRIKQFQLGLKKEGVDCSIINIDFTSSLRNRCIGKLHVIYTILKFLFTFTFYVRKSLLIFYGESVLYKLFPILKKKHKIIVERNEFPTYMISQVELSTKQIEFCQKFEQALVHCHGFITCSDELKKYYFHFLRKDCHCFVSPLIVDVDKFSKRGIPIENKISYCGDWGNNKDGVDILIKAFALIHSKYPQMKLSLIGGSTKEVEEQLICLCEKLEISDYIDFVGRINHEQMPNYLCNSRILALARPDNKQAAGGMPSKVAEYLSTGRPVVLTNVGELYKFLADGRDCYMALPNSIESFAQKLDEALSDLNASIIGERGYKVALQFDISVQSKLLLEYLKSISNV